MDWYFNSSNAKTWQWSLDVCFNWMSPESLRFFTNLFLSLVTNHNCLAKLKWPTSPGLSVWNYIVFRMSGRIYTKKCESSDHLFGPAWWVNYLEMHIFLPSFWRTASSRGGGTLVIFSLAKWIINIFLSGWCPITMNGENHVEYDSRCIQPKELIDPLGQSTASSDN